MSTVEPEINPMDKELEPTIDGVSMAVWGEGELIIIREDDDDFHFAGIERFVFRDIEYAKRAAEMTFYKFGRATANVSREEGEWIARIG